MKYLTYILQQAGLTDSKTASTPLKLNQKLYASVSTPLSDSTRYRQVVGSLVYLTITRPDIAYPVQVVGQFVSAPTSLHRAVVLCILRYLQGTMNQSLLSSESSLQLTAYSDSDWAGCIDTRRSTTDFCILDLL